MIKITKDISIKDSELQEEFIRSSGPGGQNVNKVSTAVQLRFNVPQSSLPDEVKERLERLAGKRLAGNGELVITARKFREREKNRRDALDRLVALVRKACEKPVKRKKTKPSQVSIRLRLENKKKQSAIKKQRRANPSFED